MGVKTKEEYKALSQALIALIKKYGPYIAIRSIKTIDTNDSITTIISHLE